MEDTENWYKTQVNADETFLREALKYVMSSLILVIF